MAASSLDGLYYEFHVPLGLKNLIDQVIATQPSKRNTAALGRGAPVTREWFSQPRLGNDDTTEVVTAHFKLPLSVSEITFDVLRVPCRVEVWYRDRLNNWRPALDNQRVPITLTVQASSAASWYTFHAQVYPLVAQAVQIRITRINDPVIGTTSPFVVGLRKTLIRRNVYDRAMGKLPFEEEQDVLGNVINKYIQDWDASQAIDNRPYTFWRSAPMPDPNAVVSLYLDVRSHDGSAQYMDGIFLDPTYSNQILNVYYSTDDEPGQLRLSSVTLRPENLETTDTGLLNDYNTDWRSGRGRWDLSTGSGGTSRYRVPARWGPLVSQDAWLGIEWTPDFDAAEAPANNPVLLETTPPARVTGQYVPTVYYDSGAGEIALKLFDGTTTKTYRAALSPTVRKGSALRIVVGWAYNPDRVYLSVKDPQGNQVALLDATPSPALPPVISFDGQVGFANFRGTMTAHIIKREHFADNGAAFQANPTLYVDPDPILPERDGTLPSTSLDNALYAVDWTLQPHGNGGSHDSAYTAKTWQPVWRDYITRRGKLFFPQAIAAKYLKLEFTGLTEESYPVYDAGIKVNYNVFPVSIQQSQTVQHPGVMGVISGLNTLGAQSTVGFLSAVNWLNPQTVAAAINSVFGPVVDPVTIQTGLGYTTGSIPGTAVAPISDTTRTEMSSPYIYRRGLLDPQALAASHIYYSGYTDWSQTLSNYTDLREKAFTDAFAPLRNYVDTLANGPIQGQDWWVFPGGSLKMPATVMRGLTALTETVTGRKPTTETRMRFSTTQVHRYDVRTVTRDAAVAYFAGVREVQPLITTYLDTQDPPVFSFDNYTEDQDWLLDNTRTLTGQSGPGPLTTVGRIHEIVDGDFDFGLDNWTVRSGTWDWDNTTFNGRWYPGAAQATATGTKSELLSSPMTSFPSPDVSAGQQIKVSTYVKWSGLTAVNSNPAIQLGLVSYAEGAVVSDTIVLDQISYADWSTRTSSGYVLLSGTWTVPSGVDAARVRLVVTDKATAGQVWFDSVTLTSGTDLTASVYQSFTTQSSFAKLSCEFSDSGIVRSNSMWAQQDTAPTVSITAIEGPPKSYSLTITGVPSGGSYVLAVDNEPTWPILHNATAEDIQAAVAGAIGGGGVTVTRSYATAGQKYRITFADPTTVLVLDSAALLGGALNIDATALAYYTSFIALDELGASWSDTFATWADAQAAWGSPRSLVAINIDPNRIYQGQRVLHFSRDSGAGEVGVKVRQWTNFVPNALYRICARWYKPRNNRNTITLRLRRVSDGVYIYEQEILRPEVGYWHEFATTFQRIPDSPDQVYTVELVTTGDDDDELYLSDLWVEVSHVRYLVQLGDNPVYDITDLRYSDSAILSCSEPVTEFTVEAQVYSPRAYIYGCRLQPAYLK